MKNTTILFLLCMLTVQTVFSQATFRGKLNLNQKDKTFSLSSATDSLTVAIDKEIVALNSIIDFQLIKIKNNTYNLVVKTDTIKMTASKSKIEYSHGLVFNITTKKADQIIIADEKGNLVLDANYTLKGNTVDFEITISDMKFKTELLAYATKYIYELSFNEVNTVPSYFFMY